MVQINFAAREVSCKIVYYGPGRCGKTTNLQVVHAKLVPPDQRAELISIATETDRTLYFDFLSLDLGAVAGMRTKFSLYTVPGQVYYDATRKLVLQGADGVVFVADSNPAIMQENIDSLANLAVNLHENGLDIDNLPIVLQWNKRDLPDAVPVEELEKQLNKKGWASFEAVAINGDGVKETLKAIAKLVIQRLNKNSGEERKSVSGFRPGVAPAAPTAPAPPAVPAPAAPPPPPPAAPTPAAAAKAPPAPPTAPAPAAPPPPPPTPAVPAAVVKAPPAPPTAPAPAAAAKVPPPPPAAPAPAAAAKAPPETIPTGGASQKEVPKEAGKVAPTQVHGKTMAFRRRLAEIKDDGTEVSEASKEPVSEIGAVEKKKVSDPAAPKKKGCLSMLLLAVPAGLWALLQAASRL